MLQLHRRGKIEEWQLHEAARSYIWMYERDGKALVPFKDVTAGRVRFVKFEKVEGVEWIYTDIVD